MRRLLTLALLASAVGLLLRGAVPCGFFHLQPACYVVLVPGPTQDTLQIVSVDDEPTFASSGQLVLTTVSIDTDLGPIEWIQTAFSSRVAQVRREAIFPPGQDVEQVTRANVASMDQSEVVATVAALRSLGYETDADPDGAEILEVTADGPAEGVLEVGDVVIEVDGAPTVTAEEGADTIARHDPGDELALRVLRGGQERDLDVVVGEDPEVAGKGHLGVLVRTWFDLPVHVDIDAGEVGGPSAGLMFAIAIVDLLTDEDLTGGRVVAGTGSITADGEVGQIGGVRQKVIGATERADGAATVFLAPAGTTFDEARSAPVTRDVLLVPVATLDEALVALRDLNAGREPGGALALAAG